MFFVVILAGCNQAENNEVTIVWKGNKAVAIDIPSAWIKSVDPDSVATQVKIVLASVKEAMPVFGEFGRNSKFVFTPLIPFSRGMQYEIWIQDKRTGSFSIPFEAGDATKIVNTYPLVDTVPENILKIYIEFSRPMSEGRSAQYISLIKNDTDTLHDVFLDLQPELWNENRTVLTLWLDPGRIKRDLQPNLKLGAPLHDKEKYTLYISKNWKDAQGRSLQNEYARNFITTTREERSPDPSQWTLDIPKAASSGSLSISFHKPLDHFLLLDDLQITDTSGKICKGIFEINDRDRAIHFTPQKQWAEGYYDLVINSKLEDLAGNNINRPFDRDITKTKQPSTQQTYTVSFSIKK